MFKKTQKPYTQTKRWKALCMTLTGMAFVFYIIEKIRENKKTIVITAAVAAVATHAVAYKVLSDRTNRFPSK